MAVDYAEILDTLKERTQSGRNLVFRHLADLFLAGNAPRDTAERRTLSEIMRILRPRVDIGIRRELSGHLYSMEAPPEDLLDVLLEDEDAVSGPLLDYAAIPERIMRRLIATAPIETISRLKRRGDLNDDLRARLDARFRAGKRERDRDTARQEEAAAHRSRPKFRPEPSTPPSPATSIPPAPPSPTLATLTAGQSSPRAKAEADRNGPGPHVPDRPPESKQPARHRVETSARNAGFYPQIDGLEHTLAAARQAHRTLTDFARTSSEWQWETDRKGKLTYLSDGAGRALGRPVGTLIDKRIADILKPANGDDAEEALSAALNRRTPFDELAVKPVMQNAMSGTIPDSTDSWTLAAVPKFNLDDGRFLGFRGIARPTAQVTPAQGAVKTGEQPRAEAANGNIPTEDRGDLGDRDDGDKRAVFNMDSEVAEAIASLSHEFRTPLNAILGFSEMIQLETWGKIDDTYRDNVGHIVSAAHQLNELISDILENAKLRSAIEDLYPRSFSLFSAVDEAIEAVTRQARRRRVELVAEDKGLRAIVYSDPRLVQYCLVRMLRCALDEGTPGAAITLSLDQEDNGDLRIDVHLARTAAAKDPQILSQLCRFRITLAQELATAIGATVDARDEDPKALVLSLILPPHNRFPASA